MYNNFIFDLYGTLVDIKTNEYSDYFWKRITQFFCYHGAEYSVKEMKEKYEEFCRKETKLLEFHENPEIDIKKVFVQLFEYKGIKITESECEFVSEFFRVLATRHIGVYKGVFNFLDSLKEKRKKIFLLSNAQSAFTIPELKYLGLYKYFDGIVISSNEECKKPSEEFYNILVKRYDINVSESIMIGNDGICDIAGAKKVGLDTLYIHTNISPMDENPKDVNATYIVEDGDFNKICTILLK